MRVAPLVLVMGAKAMRDAGVLKPEAVGAAIKAVKMEMESFILLFV